MSNCIYDWAKLGPQIIADYQTGRLSNKDLLAKYGVKPGALWAFLKKHGVVRTHKEARQISKVNGRLTAPTQKSKPCIACQNKFDPVNPRHIVCFTCAPTKRFRVLFDKYRLTKPDWDRLISVQNGRCALCPEEPVHVDHCHVTGIVRGLLCFTCNVAMRAVDASEDWATRANHYKKSNTGHIANLVRLNQREAYRAGWKAGKRADSGKL